ncbi:MAG: anaerobic ribonucleoside-triphosphate reductase activating protein [Muribaculaceae bacterium]
MQYHVLSIIRGTTVDGPGFRTSIYLAGCSHHCAGCQNPQSWDSSGGTIMSLQEIMDIVREEDFDVTLSGGDPLYNPESTQLLVAALKEEGRNVWIFTGYTWEEIASDSRLLSAVGSADVVVDGRFSQELKDPDLIFRGSSNQRLINVAESIKKNCAISLPE